MSTLPNSDRRFVSLRDQISTLRQVVPDVSAVLSFLHTLHPPIDPVVVDYLNGFCRNWGHHLVSQAVSHVQSIRDPDEGISRLMYDPLYVGLHRMSHERVELKKAPFCEFQISMRDLRFMWRPGYSLQITVMRRTNAQRKNARGLSLLNERTVGLLQHDLYNVGSRDSERMLSLIRQGDSLRSDASSLS